MSSRRPASFGEIGAGLQLAPNAMAVLDRLGLTEAIAAHAVYPEPIGVDGCAFRRAHHVGRSWRRLSLPLRPSLHRHASRRSARRAARGVPAGDACHARIRSRIVAVEDRGDAARARSADGRVYETDLLVGADGLHSVVRGLISDDALVYDGLVAYRGAIPIEAHVRSCRARQCRHVGRAEDAFRPVPDPPRRALQSGRRVPQQALHAGFRRLGHTGRTRCALRADLRLCARLHHADVARQALAHGRPQADRVMDAQPRRADGRCRASDVPVHRPGRLSGDRGCAGAGEQCRRAPSDVPAALRAYEAARQQRTARVQNTARAMGAFFHLDGEEATARNARMALRAGDDYALLDWLYGYRA